MGQLIIFAGAYDDLDAAEADYRALNEMHHRDELGSFDSAIVSKNEAGEVRVSKTEKPVEHGAWVGLAAGAAVGLLFPPALPAVVAAGAGGAGVGAWIGHLAHGTSRGDAKELGATLENGKAALIVVATEKNSGEIEQALTNSTYHVAKTVTDSSHEDAEREAIEALEKASQKSSAPV